MNDNECPSISVNFKTDTSPLCQVLAKKYNILIFEVETPDLTVDNVRVLIDAFRGESRYYSGRPKGFVLQLCRKARIRFEYEWKVSQSDWKYSDRIDSPSILETFELLGHLAEYDDVITKIEMWSAAQCLKIIDLVEEACSQNFRFLNMSPVAIHALFQKEV